MKRHLLLFFLLAGCCYASAQDSTKSVPVKLVTAADLQPKVVAIKTVHATDGQKEAAIQEVKGIPTLKPAVVYPNSIVRFTITNPLEFLSRRPTDQSRVVVYINGLQLKGMATSWYSSLSSDKIKVVGPNIFKGSSKADIDIVFVRNDSTKRAWDFFYANTSNFYDYFVDVDASIGWEGMSALQKDTVAKVPYLRVVYFSSAKFISWFVFFVLVVVGFIFLACKTNAIRDGDRECAYSLSLTQLLFWTTLVIGGFIYSLVLTDVTSSFNQSILYMLGISLTTTGVAGTIDSGAKKYAPGTNLKKHSNFFKDVLTGDGETFSVQRIQVFAWNLVLGLYFILFTLANKTMPEFSATLLALAGFSSASYLTAKAPENKAMQDAEQQSTQGDTGKQSPEQTKPSVGGEFPSPAEAANIPTDTGSTTQEQVPASDVTQPDLKTPIAVG